VPDPEIFNVIDGQGAMPPNILDTASGYSFNLALAHEQTRPHPGQ
jgi:hypothetical protein